jgi:hypothetical protein
MIPQSVNQQEISENAVVISMKKCLDDLDKIKEAKSKVFEEAV